MGTFEVGFVLVEVLTGPRTPDIQQPVKHLHVIRAELDQGDHRPLEALEAANN